MKKALSLLLLVLTIPFLPSPAWGHRINVFAYSEGEKVVVEVYFNDGTPAKGSLIKIYETGSDKVLVSGRTDREGRFVFNAPRKKDLMIVAIAELGHRAEYHLSLREKRPNQDTQAAIGTLFSPSKQETCSLDEEKLKEIVGQQLDLKLAPLYKTLKEMARREEKPSTSEIIGGLGYIAGLFGALAYFYSRKRRP
ncbi:hypothetical protein [Thermosulfuriphilus sp.]